MFELFGQNSPKVSTYLLNNSRFWETGRWRPENKPLRCWAGSEASTVREAHFDLARMYFWPNP